MYEVEAIDMPLMTEVNLVPQTLAELMQNPNEMGKAITDDATSTNDQE